MLEKFIQFLNRSPTVYHAAKEISERLAEKDFTPLIEGEKWELEPGKGYFVTREDSLIAAFRLPKKKPTSTTILATHIDSPALKLKPQPEVFTQEIGQVGVEIYGGPLLYTWFDRDLCISGRIVVLNKKGEIESKLVHLDEYPLIIPSLAIHLQRDVNEKGMIVNKQDHLKAIFSLEAKEKHLEDYLFKHHSFQKLLSFDLFLTPLETPRLIGFENEIISSYRLDNLSSAFASMEALLNAKPSSDKIQMALFWDHEEIGSQTYMGADSLFVDQLLERILLSYKMGKEDLFLLKAKSLNLSCDVTHAFHPNYLDKSDPQNKSVMGRGPAIKFSSKYATTGANASLIHKLCLDHKIPIQTFASRSDLPSGSTVGAMMGANLGISTVDLGIACWAMHSIRETLSTQDLINLTKLLTLSLESPLIHPEPI